MSFATHRAAPEIERQAQDWVRTMNSSRYIPPQLEMVKEISHKNRVYVYNVGPWQQERLLGSLGKAIVPACKEGQEYSEPLALEGIVDELYPINESEFKRVSEDGHSVAMQILGVGPHLNPRNSFVPFGVFVSRSNPPKKEEIDEARKQLYQKFLAMVSEADLAYSQGPKTAEETIRPETHFVAARALGRTEVECPWLRNAQLPAKREECFNCGTPFKVGIAQCPQCEAILDEEKYEANKKRLPKFRK